MSLIIKKVLIYPNYNKQRCQEAVAMVTEKLRELDMSVVISDEYKGVFDADKYLPEKEAFEKSDIAIVLGGDGTMLSAAHKACSFDTPLLGINLGTLGYMSELEISELHLLDGLKGSFWSIDRMMLKTSVYREGVKLIDFFALNEAIVSRGAVASMVTLKLACDHTPVNEYKADGLIISTPTGSTAYSMAAGGPIIDPKLEGFCVCPICSHSLADSKAMVFSPGSLIEVEPYSEKGGDLILTVDGKHSFPLANHDKVVIEKSDKAITFIKLKQDAFYAALKRKLG